METGVDDSFSFFETKEIKLLVVSVGHFAIPMKGCRSASYTGRLLFFLVASPIKRCRRDSFAGPIAHIYKKEARRFLRSKIQVSTSTPVRASCTEISPMATNGKQPFDTT